MKTLVQLWAKEIEIGEERWKKFATRYPSLFERRLTRRDLFNLKSSPVGRFLAEAENDGIPITNKGDEQRPKPSIHVSVVRQFDENELASAPFLHVLPVAELSTCFGCDDPKGRIAFRGGDKPKAAIFERKDDFSSRMWMRDDVIKKLEVESWRGVKFRGALKVDSSGAMYEGEWFGVKEVLSSVILPPMVHDIVRFDHDGKSTPRFGIVEQMSGLCDQGYNDFQPRYYANELKSLPPWDIACTYERIMDKWSRYVMVSQRVYQIFKSRGMAELCKWTPAVIENTSRPKDSGPVQVELAPPKRVWAM